MHVILLKFAENKSAAPDFMEKHNAWIAKGLSEGIFQMVGSLKSGGGFILATGEDEAAIAERVDADPFVQHGIVSAEIQTVDIKRVAPQFQKLIYSKPNVDK